jgi:hypothetical protein
LSSDPEAKVQAQLAVLCLASKPTAAFAAAYLAPFKGVGTPAVQRLKAAVTNGVSEFIFLTVSETTKPIADVFAQRLATSNRIIRIYNATAEQSVTAIRPSKAPDDLGTLDILTTTTIRFGVIKSTNSKLQTSEATALSYDHGRGRSANFACTGPRLHRNHERKSG